MTKEEIKKKNEEVKKSRKALVKLMRINV